MRITSKEQFYSWIDKETGVGGQAYYTKKDGVEMVRYRSTSTRSDITDQTHRSFSSDNGRTWSDPEPLEVYRKESDGVRRINMRPGFLDPDTGRIVHLVTNALLPTDNPLEGLTSRILGYRVSEDGDRTFSVDARVVQRGHTEENPLEGVWVGKNGVNVGAVSCRPIKRSDGAMLFPIQIAPLGPDGSYYNPGGGHTYGESAVLIGRFAEGGPEIEWDLSDRVNIDPGRSTRGLIEPAIAELSDSSIIMIMRGSNDVRPDEIPGYKWLARSTDGGMTWSEPVAWTYDDGERFYSPSSCSRLIRHSNGTLYWIGNICSSNPKGNRPRYPLVIGEVDTGSCTLIRKSVLTIDDRRQDDHELLQLSNFFAIEDRETGEIRLHVTRMGEAGTRAGSPMLYKIEVD